MTIDFKNWSIFRIIRVAVAIGCFYAFYHNSSEWFVLIIGSISLIQAIFNTGCNDGTCDIES